MKTFLSSLNGTACAALIAAALAALPGITQAQTVPLAKQRVETIGGKQYLLTSKLQKILVGSFYYNYNHDIGAPNLDSTLRRIGRAEGWTVDISKSGSEITASKLAGYQVFFANYISSWASSSTFPNANRTAVQNFVESQGGGVFVMHSSGDSRSSSNWAWYYSTLMPITYNGESSRTDVSAKVGINPGSKVHPIMEGIGFGVDGTNDSVVWPQGEWHTFSGSSITTKVADKNIFLKMNPGTCTKGGTGTNCGTPTGTYNYGATPGGYSATWTFPAGKGNVGYFMEGHDKVTMNAMTQTVWDRFYKQFMYYIAGYDTAEVVSIGRPGQDMLALDRSGVSFHPNDPGVFIARPGAHSIALYDLSGRLIRELRGRKPADYNLTQYIQGARHGVFVVRVSHAGRVHSRRYVL